MKKNLKISLKKILLYITGSLIFSVAVSVFITPNKISPGGFTGIASLLGYILPIDTGFVLLVLNIPVLVIGAYKFGKEFMASTAFVSLFISVSMIFTEQYLPSFQGERILSGAFGGILMGAGISIVMRGGATTGGVDIIAKLINRKYRHLTVGNIILFFDVAVIVLAAMVYRNLESALYSTVSIYASSRVINKVLYGADNGRTISVITENHKIICKEISEKTGRGTTVLDVIGGYTGNSHKMIICTVRRHEVSAIYSIIDSCDPFAFVVVTEAGEIIGEGFKNFT